MKITKISQQVKRAGRYSLYVDEKYSFSLSELALLNARLHIGQELSEQELSSLKQLSDDDKIYNASLNYLAIRPRTKWEMQNYLTRKGVSPPLLDLILSKLSINGLLDDEKFAIAYVHDRQLLRPTSHRKLQLELKKKNVANGIIQTVIGREEVNDKESLAHLIAKKRRQTRYQDDLKLMQFLARQGYEYADIKAALGAKSAEDY